MNYLKVFTDFVKVIEPLSDAEKGRLFTSMLEYAERGTEPQFGGNERYIWPAAKLNIDREAAFCEKQRRNAKAKHSQTQPNEANESQTSHKDKDKDKDKDKEDIVPLQSFVHSSGTDEDAELERTIERLHLDLYDHGKDRRTVKAIETAIRAMYHATDGIRVNGRTIPLGAVRSVLSGLTIDHIDYILDQLENQMSDEPVVNGQAYLMACIYNAPADCAVNNKRASWR